MESIHDQEPQRGFTGVWIPRHVWEHPELNCTERCLFGEIQALSSNTGWCFATNQYLGKALGIGDQQAGALIAKLKRLNLLEPGEFNGSRRKLRLLHDTPLKNQAPPPEKSGGCPLKNQAHSTIVSTEDCTCDQPLKDLLDIPSTGDRTNVQGNGVDKAALERTIANVTAVLNEMFSRPDAAKSPWNYAEEFALVELARQRPRFEEEARALLAYRNDLPDAKVKFFPQSVGRLLNKWEDTLDRRREHIKRPPPPPKNIF